MDAFSSVRGLKLYFCFFNFYSVSYVQHRLGAKEDVQKVRKAPQAPKVPEFSPFLENP